MSFTTEDIDLEENNEINYLTSCENTPYQRGPPITDLRSTMRRDDGNLVCKVCGNVITGEVNQSIVQSQQVSGLSIHYENIDYEL